MDTETNSDTILIVDDTPLNLHTLVQVLTLRNYRVRTANSGLQALESVRQQPPSLILLDVMMPEMDGYATCAQLKADPTTRDIPIIFLSAANTTHDKVAAFKAGGVDYITKPFHPNEVLARIATHIRLREVQQQLQAQNARLEREIAERQSTEAQIQLLRDLDMAILGVSDPESIAGITATRLRQAVDCQRVTVLECCDSATLKVLAIEAVGNLRVRSGIDEQITSMTIERFSRYQHIPNLTTVTARSPMQKTVYANGTRAYLSIPLPFQNQIIGALILESEQPHAFTAEHSKFAIQVAMTLAIGIHQARISSNLQQEIAERKQAQAKLQTYTQELEGSNAELDAFAHTVAHDLRNPLTAMIGYAYLIEKQALRQSPERVIESAQQITRGGHKMSEIINELLLLASVRKLESIPRTELDMGVIVNEVRARLEQMIADAGATLILPKRWPTTMGYAPWIEEVWANYLSNALKYGGTPPQVELGWEMEKVTIPQQEVESEHLPAGIDHRGDDTWIRTSPFRQMFVRFWVQDNGPGLTPEEQAQLFAQFTRLHQTRAEGHGLGLSIVQRIITRLGGTVGIESTPGQGSRFYFTLPAAL
ncbi:MAG: response regulator [Anaerolineae bacterium]|nr:response regulator [Anaerolineae bacterium]